MKWTKQIRDAACRKTPSWRHAARTARILAATFLLASCASGVSAPVAGVTANDPTDIYKDAYIYGFPMVDNYRVMYSYFVDKANPDYKGAWNQVHNIARVFTPQDKAIQTPNSDTPYSFLGADLCREPLVLSVPKVAGDRYFSLQFVDLYTYNFAYVGSRTTGNEAGNFLLAGPNWNGEVPEGIKSVIRSDTDLALILYRTQLFGPDDLDAVKQVQAGFTVQPLSQFEGKPPPAPAPAIDFLPPLSAEAQKTSPEFFALLNFALQFAPTLPSEKGLMERFAKVGIGAGKPFDVAMLTDAQRTDVKQGIAAAWETFRTFKAEQIDTGKKSAADGFGSRAFLGNDYLSRMSAAVLGIYGNSKEEALYPAYFVDADGKPLDGASNRYTVRFEKGELPPVNSFWSLTMYELPSSLLTENSINRYLINSRMVPDLVRNADGSITIYVQHESPGKDKEPNWLPAPSGPFFMILRAYWPKEAMLDGSWKQPPAVRTVE